MAHVTSGILTAIMLAAPAVPVFAGPLSEAEALQRGLSRPDVEVMRTERVGEAAGAAAEAGRWPNPEIEFSREQVDGPIGDNKETDLWIRQRLDLAGVGARERAAAYALVDATRLRTEMAQRDRARSIRRLFYEAIAAESLRSAMAGWQNRLDRLVQSAARRVDAGDASRYELLRLRKERAVVAAEHLERDARVKAAREELFGLIGGQPTALTGILLPPAVASGQMTDLVADHPLLRALAAEHESALLSTQAASRRAWPSLTVGAGHRSAEEGGRSADGSMFMLGVEIPIFDRGLGERDAAASRARSAAAERRLSESRLIARAQATFGELQARRAGALLLDDLASKEDDFVAIAEAAYAAGEISVAELIDAHRTELTVIREGIERAHAARESYIELQYIGEDL